MFISFSCLTVFEENGCNLCIARGSSHTQPKFATKLTSSSHGVRPLCCAFSWSRTFGLAERYKAMTPLTIPRFDRNVFLYSHHPHSSWRASQCTFTVVLQYSRRTLHALYRFLDRASPLYLGSPRAFAAIIEHAMQRRRVWSSFRASCKVGCRTARKTHCSHSEWRAGYRAREKRNGWAVNSFTPCSVEHV